MTLRTTADAIQVRCPDCPENEAGFFHGVGYGSSFGSVNAGTNDLGGAHFSGSGAERSYALTGAGCGTMGTASGWTRYTAPAAGTPPATAGVVDAGVQAWLAGCEVPCCGSFEPPAVVQKQGYRFGFNGQEKDDEIYGSTGTSYTAEFWQYSPRVAQRWELDPVFKPWLSPYSVFSGNPIAKVDPNGANDHDYKVDKSGNIELIRETDDDFDVLYNESESTAIQVDKGVLDKKQTVTTEQRGQAITYDKMRVRGDQKATDLFKFLSDNTNVEWAQIMLGNSGDKGLNYITSSHQVNEEWGASNMPWTQFQHGYTVREHRHSHPGGNPNPSGETGDIGLLQWTKDKPHLKNMRWSIYTPSTGKLHEYNESGRIIDTPTH